MSRKIHQLPEMVSDQIAAGEVIERPASVVKELVENAIDADATEVTVEFVNGGRDLIEVRDNGAGIPPDELPMAVHRHATSKIQTARDLRTVQTLGFRGEALASIASVAEVTIVSRTGESNEAAKLRYVNGEPQVKPAGRSQGTTVTVRNLFETVPARRKFLKTDRTERKHILREVRKKALAHSSVHFRLEENDRTLLNIPPGPLRERVHGILGEDMSDSMVEVDRLEPDWKEAGRFGLSGLISTGEITHTNRRHQFIFVNSRGVRDPVVYRAISKAYEKHNLTEDHPPVVLFLSLPSDRVDVNVHPRKEEVRYTKSDTVFRFVYGTIKDKLKDHFQEESEVSLGDRNTSGDQFRGSRTVGQSEESGPRTEENITRSESSPQLVMDQESGTKEQDERSMDRVLGQFRETFLVVEKRKGLFLFDQHTAHERVLYEQYRDKIKKREPSQYLSVPLTLNVDREDRTFLLDQADELEELGLTIENFGGGTLAVQSVPAYLGRRADDKRMVYDMVEELLTLRERDIISDPADDMITIMACRSAVMRGDRLMPREQNELLESLSSLEYPARCPHGRRIFYSIDNETFSDWFERPKDDLCAR